MSVHPTDDDVLQALQDLSRLSPDPRRAERLRARCHARLASGVDPLPITPASTPARRSTRRLVPALVLVVCALYVASLVGVALQLRTAF